MGAFEYTALDAGGRERKGVLEGDTARQIRQQLRDKGMAPLSVLEVRQREAKRSRGGLFQRGISATDLALLTRQFSTLVRSALPVDEALRAVSQQTEKARIRSMLMGVRSRVLEGHSLAVALEDFPHVFPELYRSTVAAGEQSGHLDVVLERLADYTESRQALIQKITLALVYPSIMLLVAVAVIVALMTYVVPKIVQVLDNIDQELPGTTKALLAISDFMREQGLLVLLILGGGLLLFRLALRRPATLKRWHGLVLRLPVFGKLTRGLNTARFARTLSILTSSGVPVLEALRIASQVVTNTAMRAAVEDASKAVREGTSVHRALDRSGYFPPMTIHLIASGESSGNLEGMLERAAVSQEREVETMISAMMGLFEPLLIVFMGGVVLFIVLAILQPILGMNNIIR